MTFYYPNQNAVIATVFCLGVIIAFLYDIFSVPGRIVKMSKTVIFINDLLFCLVACVLFVLTIYISNYGYVRWYEYAFLCLGFGTYRVVFERYILSIAVKAVRLVLKMIFTAFSVVILPVKLFIKFIYRFFKMLSEKICIMLRRYNLKRFSKRYISAVIFASKNGF